MWLPFEMRLLMDYILPESCFTGKLCTSNYGVPPDEVKMLSEELKKALNRSGL
jgi:hypothetical protein